MKRQDVIIVGAPRSGTNLLRDVLTRSAGVVTWPCDEINAIWRHGNRDHPNDEIPANRANTKTRQFVRDRFDRLRTRYGGHTVVEKTCANSLRLDFVAALLPDARFVLIIRDGVDATASALQRWNGSVDWGYTARKARFVPMGDLAHSAIRFTRNRLADRRGGHHDRQVRSWGPRFDGIDAMLREHTPIEVCATQWRRCVELGDASLARLPVEQVHRLSYEKFVQQPSDHLAELLDFLGLPAHDLPFAVSGVSATSIGRGRTSLDSAALARVAPILSPTMDRLGYA